MKTLNDLAQSYKWAIFINCHTEIAKAQSFDSVATCKLHSIVQIDHLDFAVRLRGEIFAIDLRH